MIENINIHIATVMNDMRERELDGISLAALARRLTVKLLDYYSEESRAEFRKRCGEDYEITDDDYRKYYRGPADDSIDYIELQNGKKAYFPNVISYTKLQRYLEKNNSSVPYNVLLPFCDIVNISLDNFMQRVFAKQNLEWKQGTSKKTNPIREYLNSEFGGIGEQYAYNTAAQKHLFRSLFMTGQTETSYNIIYPNISTASRGSTETTLQKGVLRFYYDDETNVCRAEFEMVNSMGRTAKFSGFAVLMNAQTASATCLCFMNNKEDADVCVMCFRLNGTAIPQVRVTQVITLNKSNHNPLSFRIVLSKEDITQDNLKHYEGYLKLNSNYLIIDAKNYNNLTHYFDNNRENDSLNAETLAEFDAHFGILSDAVKLDYFQVLNNIKIENANDKIIKIDYDTNSSFARLKNGTLIAGVPLLSSWLKKHSLSANFHELDSELDNEIEEIYAELISREG